MYAIIHALTGAFIGFELHSIILIVLISLILHFIFDMIPHHDVKWDKDSFHNDLPVRFSKFSLFVIFFDFTCAFILIGYLTFKLHNKLVLLGSFISLLPDLAFIGYKTKLNKNKHFMKFIKFHSKIQKNTGFKTSIIIQGMVIILLIVLYFVL